MMLTQPQLTKKLRAVQLGQETEIDVGPERLKLRVTKAGAKTWVLRYRVPGGQRRLKIGAYPAMGLGKARSEARKLLGRIEAGEDPSAARQADRRALRMIDLFGDGKGEDPKADKYTGWYLRDYVRTAGKLGTAKTPHSIRTDRCYIAKHVRQRRGLMRKRVDAVTPADLERIKAELSPGAWRKVRNILRVAFRHAESIGAIPVGSNPAVKVKAAPDKKVERYLSPTERKRLDAALERAERLGPSMKEQPRGTTGGLGRHLVRVFRVLSLTGMRLGSVLDMRWECIDWRHNMVRVPTKTGEMSVPLTPQAMAFLRREKGNLSRVGRVCGTVDGGRITTSNIERAWRSIRTTAELADVRIHDLRHSWASDAASAGVPLQVIGAVLGHADPKTTHRYAHLHDRAIRDGLKKTGAAIARATRGVG